MEAKKLAQLCRELADNRKAEDVHYFVIASGTSEPHLRAISEEIMDKLADEHGVKPRAADGSLQGGWLVLDFFDVIVHIMRTDARRHYDLESLWGDAPKVRSRKKPAPVE